jgi:HTH-type transcriptional regulator/antitoxin HigA
LQEIERLWDAEEGTADGDRMETLVTLAEAYGIAHFPIDLPDSIEEALSFEKPSFRG